MKVLWSPIYYKIEGNYFKGKAWVLYKSKTKTSGKGQEIIVLLISVTILMSGISTHTTSDVSLTLIVAVWVCRFPLRFLSSKYLSISFANTIRWEHSHSPWYSTSMALYFEDKKPLTLSSLNSRQDLLT